MPHFGLMDAAKMTEADASLLRSRLHLRGGKQRLQNGLLAAGIAALYDSVLFGMRYYIAAHEQVASYVEDTDLWDAAGLFEGLTRAGVFDDPLSFNRFNLIVEQALWQDSFSFDTELTLAVVEKMLTTLEVMPFDEAALPQESATAL